MPRLSQQPSFKPAVKERTAVKRKANKKKGRKRLPRVKTGVSSELNKQQEKKSVVPPELLSRFPSALQEINRRIMGQNFIWLALQLGWRYFWRSDVHRNGKELGTAPENGVCPVCRLDCCVMSTGKWKCTDSFRLSALKLVTERQINRRFKFRRPMFEF